MFYKTAWSGFHDKNIIVTTHDQNADKDINAIDTKMLIDLLVKIDLEGKYDTREKIQSLLTRIHKYAVGMGWANSNPAREISSDLFTKKEKKHFAHPENLKDVKLVLSLIKQAIG